MIYINSDLLDPSKVTARPDVLSSLEGCTVDITLGAGTLRVYCIYNPPTGASVPSNVLDSLLARDLTREPAVVAGDFNLHSHVWDPDAPRDLASSEEFVDWTSVNGLTLLNSERTFTRIGHGAERNSILDLTWVSPRTQDLFPPCGWSLAPLSVATSDHYAINFSLFLRTREDISPPARSPFSRLRFADMAKWKTVFQRAMAHHHTALTNPATPIQERWDIMHDSLLLATMASVPPPSKVKRNGWWTPILDPLRDEVARLRGCLSRAAFPSQSHDNLTTELVIARSRFRKGVKAAKHLFFTNKLELCKDDDIWGLLRWGSGARKYSSPPVSHPDRPP